MISKFLLSCLLVASPLIQADSLYPRIDAEVLAIDPSVVSWRREIHANPELGNEEHATAALIATQLRALNFDRVETGVAGTGVVGTLIGGKPGPVVALRADMDALPVTELTGLPFASTSKGVFQGKEVGVMHACGHDAHVSMLLGVAHVLASIREALPGSVKFIFQPAEEGVTGADTWGARMMVEEGVLEGPQAPEVIFALHVGPADSGTINYRAGGIMAGADMFDISVRGKSTHGAMPWTGVDPVIVAAESIVALQLIPSRHIDITTNPTVITIGSIHGGNRGNIVPEEVVMQGTLRTFDPEQHADIVRRIHKTVENIADTHGATANVDFGLHYPVTYNLPVLMQTMLPVLREAAGSDQVHEMAGLTGSEDFSFFQEKIPGLYLMLGTAPEDPARRFTNHSPNFDIDESALQVGVKTLAYLSYGYMLQNPR